MDQDQLTAALDASFGDGPPMAPAADRLEAGRRAVRRRHRAVLAATVAAVVVVAGGAAVAGRGGSAPRGTDPAGPVSSTSTTPSSGGLDEQQLQAELDRLAAEAQARAERTRKAELVSNQFPASLDPVDGSLVVENGWTVTQRVENPMGYTAPEASLGVEVAKGDHARWMLLSLDQVYDRDGNPIVGEVSPSASADDAAKGYSRFQDWLTSMVELQGGVQAPPLVVVSADDEVTAGPGATLVRVEEVPVVEGYTSPGDRVARVTLDGRTWWVVIRGHGPDAETVPVDGDVVPGSSLDALLGYLAQQTRSGEGVR